MRPLLVFLLLSLTSAPALAELRVFACEPEWGALVRELGGERVTVYVATTAQQDPHHIQARPSLIGKLRRADLLVCTGAQLEIGWLPVLLRRAANPRVQPGRPGHFEAARHVTLLDVPASVDRAHGDVHPDGDPHIHTDPRNIEKVAVALGERLASLDPAHAEAWQRDTAAFLARWRMALQGWQARAEGLQGLPVVTQHKGWIYLVHWLGLREVIRLEPRPGVPPSASHLQKVLETVRQTPVKAILRAAYQPPRAADWLHDRIGVPVLVLPYTVGGNPRASDLFGLFDDTLAQLERVAR